MRVKVANSVCADPAFSDWRSAAMRSASGGWDMNKRLMLAHINNQTAPLEEVLGLLRELHGAWQQISASGRTAPHSTQHPIAA